MISFEWKVIDGKKKLIITVNELPDVPPTEQKLCEKELTEEINSVFQIYNY